MRRRSVLATVLAGSLPVTGCVGLRQRTGPELPDDCPRSQDLGVRWPEDLDESAAGTFVEQYEEAYYRQEIIDTLYDPQSRLFGYQGWISRIKGVTNVEGGGWRVHFSGVVNIQRGDLVFEASATDSPGDNELIPIDRVEDERLGEVLHEAAASGQESVRIGPSLSDEYLDRFAELSSGFEIAKVGDSDTLYFDVEGTAVELVVWSSPPNRDHFWEAWYFVDKHVVWRSGEADTDPRDGELLECRPSD